MTLLLEFIGLQSAGETNMNAGKGALWILSSWTAIGVYMSFGMTYCGMSACAQAPTISSIRGTSTEKGSVLWYSRVVVGWNASGDVVQDTIIELTNDFPENVHVQMYYVNGDPAIDGPDNGRTHPGCNWLDNLILLTNDEPAYWSAATGLPKGTSPFGELDPGSPPGRPDPHQPGRWVVRGYIVAWAVDRLGVEINWNHLTGRAVLVDYEDGSAWEYAPWAFQARSGQRGSRTDAKAGVLLFNGGEFDLAPGTLLLNFPSIGSRLNTAGTSALIEDVELTLHPLTTDFRDDGFARLSTNVRFTIWNMNEVKLSGVVRPLECWESERLGSYGFPNHFLLQNLQTDRGKAQLDALGSTQCASISLPAPLLGVVSKRIRFSPKTSEEAGVELAGYGCEEGALLYDVPAGGGPEERNLDGDAEPASKQRRADTERGPSRDGTP